MSLSTLLMENNLQKIPGYQRLQLLRCYKPGQLYDPLSLDAGNRSYWTPTALPQVGPNIIALAEGGREVPTGSRPITELRPQAFATLVLEMAFGNRILSRRIIGPEARMTLREFRAERGPTCAFSIRLLRHNQGLIYGIVDTEPGISYYFAIRLRFFVGTWQAGIFALKKLGM
ncbi:MAG: hypothetical protein Q3972_00785 [Corynebacterium sp.]|nr:hypothetical protein [Corynebacterium sp.]